jgi:PAS domain S-box
MSIIASLQQFMCSDPQNLKQFLDILPLGVILAEPQGDILMANPASAKLTGYTVAELQKLNTDNLSHPNDVFKEKLERQRCNTHYQMEKRFKHRDGHSFWVDSPGIYLKDAQGQPQCLMLLVQDISDRKYAETVFVENERRFRQIFEEVPVGMAIIGFNHRLLRVNHTLCDILGYSEAELLSRPFDVLTHPEDAMQDALLAKQLYYGRIPHYQVEKRCIRKDQQVIWVLLTAYVLRNDKGKAINSLAMIRDITKQKLAEAAIQHDLQRKELCIKEVHHRVKNNLHVIANLLELQAQTIDDPQITALFYDSQNRIYAMSLIHEQLYHSNHQLGQIEFASYLQNLVDNLCMSYGLYQRPVRQKLELETITLNTETAVPCGLIVNEVVTNSLKYAWRDLTNVQPEIYISFKKHPSQNQLELIIRDNGIGLSPEHQNTDKTLGLRLVRMLVRQLDGTLEIKNDAGTQFKITFTELAYRDRLQLYEGSNS